MLWGKTAKHGMDVRRKGGHVGDHHHDIVWLHGRVVVKPVPKSVVQYFNFTQGRMRLHHLNAAIVGQQLWRIGQGV